MPRKAYELQGEQFGKWLVVRFAHKHQGQRYWWCRCQCGIERAVNQSSLIGGRSKGCVDCNQKRHGKKDHPLYNRWVYIRGMCNNPNNESYKYYGGKGIKVWEEWNDFERFAEDIGGPPEPAEIYILGRLDGDKDWEPGNVKWMTYQEKAEYMEGQERDDYIPHDMSPKAVAFRQKLVRKHLRYKRPVKFICEDTGLSRQQVAAIRRKMIKDIRNRKGRAAVGLPSMKEMEEQGLDPNDYP